MTSLLQERRACAWCRSELEATAAHDAKFCSKICRQTVWRLRRRGALAAASSTPGRFAYADPPYPGLSSKYYRHESTFAGEVDHAALLSRLEERRQSGELLGWALSTSARALGEILPLCPPTRRIASWVKPHGVSTRSFGMHNVWEPLIVVGGRQRPPGVPDALVALPARGGGTLPGRKPLAFCSWLFRLLGMAPGDELDDLFPGSGIVTRAWVSLGAGAERRPPSPEYSNDDAPSLVDERRRRRVVAEVLDDGELLTATAVRS